MTTRVSPALCQVQFLLPGTEWILAAILSLLTMKEGTQQVSLCWHILLCKRHLWWSTKYFSQNTEIHITIILVLGQINLLKLFNEVLEPSENVFLM